MEMTDIATTWQEAQAWETDWWSTCQNTYGEEEKQWLYAKRMGLTHRMFHDTKSPYNVQMDGRSVIDIGGGPVSLLLKCHNLGRAMVVDPMPMPDWVVMRYHEAGIEYRCEPGEEIDETGFDEAWIYNCLQHTREPYEVISRAREAAKYIRVFEWIDTRTNAGHPHAFTAELLDKWFRGYGKTETLNGEANCYGRCYFGIFPSR